LFVQFVFEMVQQLFHQDVDSQTSCYICHMKIFIQKSSEIDGLNSPFNYAVCSNGHSVHSEPCLQNWLFHSNQCPVCHMQYSDSILSKYHPIIEAIKKQEEQKRFQQQAMEQQAKEIQQMKSMEAEKEIKDKIDRANKLIEGNKIGAALNLLFDIIDNFDANNLDAKFLIGKAQYLSEKYDLAVSNFMKLVKLKFDYPFGFYYLGKSFEKIGSDKAKWAFERSRENFKKLIQDTNTEPSMKTMYQQFLDESDSYLKKI
jgi:hypothetical protein